MPLGEPVDVLQVGARNMQNYSLLEALGKVRKPVLLKRGLSSTLEELLMAAEYILEDGNEHVMLCERGIRTFETAMRFTLDVGGGAVAEAPLAPARHRRPVPCGGRPPLVAPLSLAAAAVCAGRSCRCR